MKKKKSVQQSYKAYEKNFIKSRFEFFKIENQYEKYCDQFFNFDDDYDESNILNAIVEFENNIDIDKNIENIKNYICKKDMHFICQDLYSPDFINSFKNIMVDPEFDQMSDSIIIIVRNLWKYAISPDNDIIIDEEFISIIFSYFLKDQIKSSTVCLIFEGFVTLLSKYPDILPLLVDYNIIDIICDFFFDANLDQRNCKGLLAFPFFLIYFLILNSSPNSSYLESFFEICLKYISSQYITPRILSTQCIFEMCSQNDQFIETFFSIPNNIEIIIRAHYLISQNQIKFLYALDTLLLQSGIDEIYVYYVNFDNYAFFKNLSKFIYNRSNSQNEKNIKHVLTFLTNVMDIFWKFLIHPNLYGCIDEPPIIYEIIDMSQESICKIRILAGNCISRFILLSGFDEKFQIGQDGGFSTLCSLVQNCDTKSQYIVLCALKELILLNEVFKDEANEQDLQSILYQIESEDEECSNLITDILNNLNP